MKRLIPRLCVVGSSVAFVLVAMTSLNAARPAPEPGPRTDPRDDQTYIGTQKCAACHFEQFTIWKQTKHAKGFEILPAKYRTDESCLKCHSTGFGTATGFKDATSTSLAGTTCEACHGPGSNHAEVAKPFAKKKTLSEDEQKIARDSIHKLPQNNACVTCHLAQGHKAHPKYDK